MSKRGDKEFLCDMKEAIDRINNYIHGQIDSGNFTKTKLSDACLCLIFDQVVI
jgi:uncharacterized protein with HEPN domain